MDLTRVLVTSAVTLTRTFQQDEVPTDAAGSVSVTVTRLDGTVVAGPTSATHTGTGVYQYNPPAQASLDTLVVSWTGTFNSVPVTVRELLEIVGGFFWEISRARTGPPPLDATRFPTDTLKVRRTVVESECEEICGVAFVPRFDRFRMNGDDSNILILPHTAIRLVRGIKVNGVALSAGEIASINLDGLDPSGIIEARRNWTYGRGNIIVEVERGHDQPPPTIVDASLIHLRARLSPTEAKIPSRAISWASQDGGTYRLSMPGKKRLGIPEVDAAYERATEDGGGFA